MHSPMSNDGTLTVLGIDLEEPRTVYLRSGDVLSGVIHGFSALNVNGAMQRVHGIQLRLPSGDVVAIPWHAVDLVAASPVAEVAR